MFPAYAALQDEHGTAAIMARDAAVHARLGSSLPNQRQPQQIDANVDMEWDFTKLEGVTLTA